MTAQLHLTGPLGEHVTLTAENAQDLTDKQRAWGARGWTPGTGEIPAGGFTLPLCMADTLDWAMLGASEFTLEDQHCVAHRGHIYKRREFEAQTGGKKLPASVKYSRGAKPTDPPHIKEGDEGGVQYVTLITFRGGGKALKEYEKQPRAQQRARPTQAVPPTQAAQPDDARKRYFAIVKGTEFETDAGRAELVSTVTKHVTGGKRVTDSLTEALAWNDKAITDCIYATAETWAKDARTQGAHNHDHQHR